MTDRIPFDEFSHIPKLIQKFKKVYPDGVTKEQEDLFQVIGRYMDLCMVNDSKSYMASFEYNFVPIIGTV